MLFTINDNLILPHSVYEKSSSSSSLEVGTSKQYNKQIHGQAPGIEILRLIIKYAINKWVISDDLPGFASDPPTILVFCTFEYPHPSLGVNKRPFRLELNELDSASSKKKYLT